MVGVIARRTWSNSHFCILTILAKKGILVYVGDDDFSIVLLERRKRSEHP
jgi:hypothetical protein